MNKLDQLINELCPNGVEYKAIQSFSQLLKGMNGVSNKWANYGNCQFIEYKNAYDNLKIDVTRLPFATVKKIENQIELKQGDILFTSASETPDECAISSVIEDEISEGIFIDDHLFGIRVNDKTRYNSTFLNYYFRSDSFRRIVNKTVRGVTRYYISIPNFMKLQIPIPPLPVQEEIVRILDKFTELTSELTTKLTSELTARKQQYEYYSESLLNFKEEYDCKKIKLKEICDIYLGLTATPKYTNSGVKFISAQNTSKDFLDLENVKYISEIDYAKATSNAKPKRGDILFTRVGSNLGHPVIVDTDEKLCIFVSLGFLRIKNKNIVSNSYLKHWMNTDLFWSQVRKKVFGAAKVNLNTKWLKEFELTLPPIDIQEKIVNHLDCFEKYFNFLHEDLSLEIKVRQKQYEYYRDKLLTFKKKEAVENE